MSRGDIRGIYASASLKLSLIVNVSSFSPRYPRHLRLGLIEAQGKYGPDGIQDAYPRHLRLGLIEATGDRGLRNSTDAYPRHLRLGLIEAREAFRAWAMWRGISEAFTPRPH